jgi:anti-sigma factor RsiW
MSCQTTHERLPDWLAGLMASADAQGVESHLEVCGECRAEAELLRMTRASFSPAALGERVEPNWAAMRQKVLREARLEREAPSFIDRARTWLAEAWELPRMKPALAGAAVLLVCVMAFSLTVGPNVFGPRRATTLASLSVDELEALSEVIDLEGDGETLAAEPLDAGTMRELEVLPADEVDRLLRTI